MQARSVLIFALVGGVSCQSPPTDGFLPLSNIDYADPTVCGECHTRQYREWSSSMMAYSAISPVFNALEAMGNHLTDGEFAVDGETPLLCQSCHAPAAVQKGLFVDYDEMDNSPSRDFIDSFDRRGLSCDVCHQIPHADYQGSLLGDGIANAAFDLVPRSPKYGPIDDPIDNDMHEPAYSPFLQSANFCGMCHDVRLPGTDSVTTEPFLRLENAFTEWERGPYAGSDNPYGKLTTCQDCHMSAYPYESPGTYFIDHAANYPGVERRRVSSHYFTGVDIALVDFPWQDSRELDGRGHPAGQAQRRTDLLRAACTLELAVPATSAGGTMLPINVSVTNSGAGHNVPTGFSQERQMWIELTVRDANGVMLYQSGTMTDKPHPETGEFVADGSVDDEDLENILGSIDPFTLEAAVIEGPDHNQRPAKQLGLITFGNEFKRMTPSGLEEVHMPFLADHMDNGHSIPPLQTKTARYEIDLPMGAVGPLAISARLRFRPFPPRFLRSLAQGRPDLVNEAMVDRNRIVDMAEADASVELN